MNLNDDTVAWNAVMMVAIYGNRLSNNWKGYTSPLFSNVPSPIAKQPLLQLMTSFGTDQ